MMFNTKNIIFGKVIVRTKNLFKIKFSQFGLRQIFCGLTWVLNTGCLVNLVGFLTKRLQRVVDFFETFHIGK